MISFIGLTCPIIERELNATEDAENAELRAVSVDPTGLSVSAVSVILRQQTVGPGIGPGLRGDRLVKRAATNLLHHDKLRRASSTDRGE